MHVPLKNNFHARLIKSFIPPLPHEWLINHNHNENSLLLSAIKSNAIHANFWFNLQIMKHMQDRVFVLGMFSTITFNSVSSVNFLFCFACSDRQELQYLALIFCIHFLFTHQLLQPKKHCDAHHLLLICLLSKKLSYFPCKVTLFTTFKYFTVVLSNSRHTHDCPSFQCSTTECTCTVDNR